MRREGGRDGLGRSGSGDGGRTVGGGCGGTRSGSAGRRNGGSGRSSSRMRRPSVVGAVGKVEAFARRSEDCEASAKTSLFG